MTATVPQPLRDLARSQAGLISARQAEQSGITANVRSRLCRSGEWLRVCRGVFDVAPGAPRTWPERRRRAAVAGLLRYGPSAAAVGVSALALLGVEGLAPTGSSHVVIYGSQARERLPSERRSTARDTDGLIDVEVRQFDRGMSTTLVGGFRVAAPEWALAQAVPEMTHRHAVAAMDSMLRQGLIGQEGIVRAHSLARGRRGVARTHEWWGEADARAESPLESFGRVDCIEHDVPPDDLQVEVRDSVGVLLGRGDMGWRLGSGEWLLAELDGREHHEGPTALLHDRSRQNQFLLDGGVHLLRFTARDASVRGHIARTVRRALRKWAPEPSGPARPPPTR